MLKAVFLCAGQGTRMRPISYSVPKHLVPLANKKLLRYNVEKVIDGGIHDIGLVVSPEMESHYRKVLGEGRWGATFTYLHQVNPRGLAHAVDCARDFVGDEPFLVYLGDNLLEEKLSPMIEEFSSSDASASILLSPVEDPERFGVAVLDGDRIVNLVEKPDDPPSNLAIVGAYGFTEEIFNAIEVIEPSDRGELEITDAIQELINRGKLVTPSKLTGWWLDVGRPRDALNANRVILENLTGRIDGDLRDTELEKEGKIEVGENVRVSDSRLVGPLSLHRDIEVEDSTIGPNVSIGPNCRIKGSQMENSIVMEGTLVERAKLTNSILGAESRLSLTEESIEIFAGNQTCIESSS